jgi:hypothetical protein
VLGDPGSGVSKDLGGAAATCRAEVVGLTPTALSDTGKRNSGIPGMQPAEAPTYEEIGMCSCPRCSGNRTHGQKWNSIGGTNMATPHKYGHPPFMVEQRLNNETEHPGSHIYRSIHAIMRFF